MEYFVMRKAITVISVTMLGASVVIFLTALTISRHKEQALPKQVSLKTDQPAEALVNLVHAPPPEQKQSLDVTNKMELSAKPPEDAVEQNVDADKKPVNSSVKQSLQSTPEATPPQIDQKPPPALADPKVVEEKSPVTQGPIRLLVLSEGSFSPGVARPEAKAQEAIAKIIPLIQARPLDTVIIEGHADKSIPEGFNLIQASKWNKIVSMLRAKAVAQVLRQKGVAGDRIIVRGLGDEVPLASNLTKKGRSKNRRVEIKLSSARH